MGFKKELMDKGFLIVAVILNFIFFTFNFYRGVSSNSWIFFVVACMSMSAILFCVWVMGYKHAVENIKKTILSRPMYQETIIPTFVKIEPMSIKKSGVDRFVNKNVGKTKQEEWKKYQEKNK